MCANIIFNISAKFLLSIYLCTTILQTVCVQGRTPDEGSHVWNHQKLYKDLMKDYMKSVRPAVNNSHQLPVQVYLYFTSFDDLDEEKQVLSVTGWMRMVWTDFQLTWNPNEYGSLNELEIPVTDLWYPDLYIDNTKSAERDFPTHQLALVHHTGTVLWAQIISLRTQCPVDLAHFPYDSHNCSIYLSSWAYDKQKLHVTAEVENATHCPGMSGNDWIVSECSFSQFEVRYPQENGTYIDYPIISYSLLVSRVSSFASHLFVAPSVALCLITPVIFILPPESREKFVFGIGALISDVLLLGELIKFIPAAYPSIPLIGKYFLANIVLCSLSLVISALVVNMWGRRSTRVNGPPQFITAILLGPVAKWLFVSADQFCESLDDDVTDHKDDVSISINTDGETLQQLPIESMAGKARLRQAQNYVRKIVRLQWHQLAVVVDRIFLILYVIILLCLTLMFTQYM